MRLWGPRGHCGLERPPCSKRHAALYSDFLQELFCQIGRTGAMLGIELKLPEAVRAECRVGDVTHGRTAGQGLVARREDPSIRRVETGWVTGPMGARRG